MIGAGTAGIVFLMLKGRSLAHQKNAAEYGVNQNTTFHPVVQQRVRQTLGYFGGSLAMTGALVSSLRNSRFAYMNPWVLLFGSLAALFGTHMVDYHQQPVLKHLMLGAFVGTISLSMIPLINQFAMPVIYDALFATGISMGCLGAVAYNAPSEQFLNWGGALSIGLGCLIGAGLINMFYPSKALFNIYLYGGVFLFGAFTMYDIQKLMFNAKRKHTFDPINESLHIYLDAINMFQHFLMIFGQNKKK